MTLRANYNILKVGPGRRANRENGQQAEDKRLSMAEPVPDYASSCRHKLGQIAGYWCSAWNINPENKKQQPRQCSHVWKNREYYKEGTSTARTQSKDDANTANTGTVCTHAGA